MDHPLVKWTLNPQNGQRKWTNIEATVLLEDLRTDVRLVDRARCGDKDNDGDGDDDEKGEEEEKEKKGNQEEEEEERRNQEDGAVIAAGAAVAAVAGNQAKEEDAAAADREEVVQVVQDPVACGRCFNGIDLNSAFYRCVGHSCRGVSTR
jgi:hypothetical protein